MRNTFVESLIEEAARDERVWLLCGDLGFSVLEEFAERFPDRFLNVGVAEQNMTGVAAGLAMRGKVVFTYSIANFPIMRCLEQIRNDVCYHRLPVKVVSVGGGLAYGPLGYSHHAIEDLAVMRSLPGMTVVAPGDPVETRLAVPALVADPGPAYLRLGKAGEPVVHEAPPSFALGRAIDVRDGDDATIISTGGMLRTAVDAAELLGSRGLSVGVISMPTVKPLDRDAVLRAAATGLVCPLEEHGAEGGLSDAVARVVADEGVSTGFLALHLAPKEESGTVGSQAYLVGSAGLSVEGVADRIAERARVSASAG